MTMPSPDFDENGEINFRDLSDVIAGAKHCISGKNCDFSCPYFHRKRKRCVGDFRKDLLKWVIYLRNQNKRLSELRPTTGDCDKKPNFIGDRRTPSRTVISKL